MFRFTLLPLLFFFGTILFGIISYVIYRKIKRGLLFTYKKGAEIANEQQHKWKQKEQLKKLPDIVQKGFDDLKAIETANQNLPEEWQNALHTLISKAREILGEVASDPDFEKTKLTSMRAFFIHTLDALKQFTQKLSSDHMQMSATEIEIARENITVIKADLLHHQQILQKKRKFDFEVLMDVIKARLKS